MYKLIMTSTAILLFLVALLWLFAPGYILSISDFDFYGSVAMTLARQFAPMFFASSVMVWLSRSPQLSPRLIICATLGVALMGLGILTIYRSLSIFLPIKDDCECTFVPDFAVIIALFQMGLALVFFNLTRRKTIKSRDENVA